MDLKKMELVKDIQVPYKIFIHIGCQWRDQINVKNESW
jgi:hypothetical protein